MKLISSLPLLLLPLPLPFPVWGKIMNLLLVCYVELIYRVLSFKWRRPIIYAFVSRQSTTQVVSSGNALYLYSWGARFERRPGHRLSWEWFTVIFLNPTRQMPGQHFQLGHNRFFSISFPIHLLIIIQSFDTVKWESGVCVSQLVGRVPFMGLDCWVGPEVSKINN